MVYIMMMFPETKGMVMNKRTRTKPVSDKQALNDLKRRAENSDQHAQFDSGLSHATYDNDFDPSFAKPAGTSFCFFPTIQ